MQLVDRIRLRPPTPSRPSVITVTVSSDADRMWQILARRPGADFPVAAGEWWDQDGHEVTALVVDHARRRLVISADAGGVTWLSGYTVHPTPDGCVLDEDVQHLAPNRTAQLRANIAVWLWSHRRNRLRRAHLHALGRRASSMP